MLCPRGAFLGPFVGCIHNKLVLALRQGTFPIVPQPLKGRHPRLNRRTECRNINLLSIGYAFRPRLRGRLTLGGFTFPRKP